MRLLPPIALLATTCLMLSSAGGQVMVFDGPNEIHFAATVDTLKSELEQVRSVALAINGTRDLGSGLRSLPESTVLPIDLQSTYQALTSSKYGGADALCIGRNPSNTALCRLDAVKTALDLSLAAALYADAPSRQTQIELLQSAFLASQDLKSSADLGARTSLTSASFNAQTLQMQLFVLQSQLQDQAIAKARRLDQLERVTTSSRAIDTIAPLEFEEIDP